MDSASRVVGGLWGAAGAACDQYFGSVYGLEEAFGGRAAQEVLEDGEPRAVRAAVRRPAGAGLGAREVVRLEEVETVEGREAFVHIVRKYGRWGVQSAWGDSWVAGVIDEEGLLDVLAQFRSCGGRGNMLKREGLKINIGLFVIMEFEQSRPREYEELCGYLRECVEEEDEIVLRGDGRREGGVEGCFRVPEGVSKIGHQNVSGIGIDFDRIAVMEGGALTLSSTVKRVSLGVCDGEVDVSACQGLEEFFVTDHCKSDLDFSKCSKKGLWVYLGSYGQRKKLVTGGAMSKLQIPGKEKGFSIGDSDVSVGECQIDISGARKLDIEIQNRGKLVSQVDFVGGGSAQLNDVLLGTIGDGVSIDLRCERINRLLLTWYGIEKGGELVVQDMGSGADNKFEIVFNRDHGRYIRGRLVLAGEDRVEGDMKQVKCGDLKGVSFCLIGRQGQAPETLGDLIEDGGELVLGGAGSAVRAARG